MARLNAKQKAERQAKASERQANVREQRLEDARRDSREVGDGVAERVELGRGRGEAFAVPRSAPGRAKAVRKLSGLASLAHTGKLNAVQMAAGLAYAEAYRDAMPPASLRSTLDDSVGGGSGLCLAAAHAAMRRRLVAEARLARMRKRLGNQADLVKACDDVCGLEFTPREVCPDGHAAQTLVRVLQIALDLMAGERVQVQQ
jgi:hypothetical protein